MLRPGATDANPVGGTPPPGGHADPRRAEARRAALHRAEARRAAPHRAEARRAELRRPRPEGRRHRARNPTATGPQKGIVGALGLATIAAPFSGVLSAVVPQEVRSAALPPTALRGTLVETSSGATGHRGASAVPVRAPGRRNSAETLLVSRGTSRSVLPGCDGTVPVRQVSNGRLPSANLCTLWDGENQLRADSAIALARLNIAYNQRFGHDLEMVDSYRTLAEQRAVKASRGDFAARPGTSEHGWGLAVDLGDGVASGTSDTYRWLRSNARAYGWENPDWARSDGDGPYEPWHWEYTQGRGEGTGA